MASSIRPSCLVRHRAKRVAVPVPMAIVHRKAVVPQGSRRAMTDVVQKVIGRATVIASQKVTGHVTVIANRKRIVRATENVAPTLVQRAVRRVAMTKRTSRATRTSKKK